VLKCRLTTSTLGRTVVDLGGLPKPRVVMLLLATAKEAVLQQQGDVDQTVLATVRALVRPIALVHCPVFMRCIWHKCVTKRHERGKGAKGR
jgi:hypothetical protein